jgi:hypothetical protein
LATALVAVEVAHIVVDVDVGFALAVPAAVPAAAGRSLLQDYISFSF